MADEQITNAKSTGVSGASSIVQEAQERAKICADWYATAHERMMNDYKFSEGDSSPGS